MAKPWREAILRVLAEESRPLHYREISEFVLSRGYFSSKGARPDNLVYRHLTESIRDEREQSPFVRVDRGIFALKDLAGGPKAHRYGKQTPSRKHRVRLLVDGSDEPESSESIIRCLGMYWQRDLVLWRSDPKMFGRQQAPSKSVDFGKQIGIYILHDRHTVVYVGRAIDRPIGRRLFEHTLDRMSSRWDRFSWFGLLDLTDGGELVEVEPRFSTASIITTLESILIETLEPPQNRRRGDDFSHIEFIQDVDPELRERQIQATLRTIEEKLRGQS